MTTTGANWFPNDCGALSSCAKYAGRGFSALYLLLLCLSAAALLMAITPARAQTFSVANGSTLYNVTTLGTAPNPCSGCHISVPPPSAVGSADHRNMSNNPGQILNGLGSMPFFSASVPTATQRMQLALYLGQYKAPSLQGASAVTALVKSSGNVAGVVDVYPRLRTDGSSGVAQDAGGVTVLSAPNAASTSVSVADGAGVPQYNITYTPSATLGADTLTFRILNPTGNTTGTVSVNVVGISNTNQTFLAGAAVNLPITIGGGVATITSISLLSGSLPAGLAIAGNAIQGTIAANAGGTYNMRV